MTKIKEYCEPCTFVNPKTLKRCKMPSACRIGCVSRCRLHGNYNKGVCSDEALEQVQQEKNEIMLISNMLSELSSIRRQLQKIKQDKTQSISKLKEMLL